MLWGIAVDKMRIKIDKNLIGIVMQKLYLIEKSGQNIIKTKLVIRW